MGYPASSRLEVLIVFEREDAEARSSEESLVWTSRLRVFALGLCQGLASDSPDAKLAIDLFIHRLVRECGALSACLGGLDVLAFTGGIGEHDVSLRQRTCDALAYLGVRIDSQANQAATGDAVAPIHAEGSSVEVWVVPTDEGRVAAQDAARLMS